MSRSESGNLPRWAVPFLCFLTAALARADQVEMQNGDHYAGTVVFVSSDSVLLQSEVLGKVNLPRGKVRSISFGPAASTNLPALVVLSTNGPALAAPTPVAYSNVDVSTALRQLGANSNLVQHIRNQFLEGAGPAANDKFDQLLAGLTTGNIDMNALRAEAKSAADQVRALQKDMGGDAGETLNAYLAILDDFLAQSAPPAAPLTNSPHGSIIIR
jgi:hypothetical protein